MGWINHPSPRCSVNSWLHLTGCALSGCRQILELLPRHVCLCPEPFTMTLLLFTDEDQEKQDASERLHEHDPPQARAHPKALPALCPSTGLRGLPLLTRTPIQMQAGWPLFTCSTPLLWIGKACLVFSQPPWPPVRPLTPNFLE